MRSPLGAGNDIGSGPDEGFRSRAPAVLRPVWLLLALITIGGTLAVAPDIYRGLNVVCSGAACAEQFGGLTSGGVAALQRIGLSTEAYALLLTLLFVAEALISCVVAALIFLRSREPLAFLVSLAILLIGGQSFFGELGEQGWFLVMATHNYLLFVTLVLAFYLFPSGRFVPRWSRWVALALFVTEFFYSYFPDAPFSPHNFFPPLEMGIWFGALLLIPISQIYRYRKVSTVTERQQTKWVVAGITVALISLLTVIQLGTLLPPDALEIAQLVSQPIVTFGLLAIPISFAIAILRYRLWDIDLLVRRTLIYGVLTVVLALIYFVSVVLLQSVFNAMSGQDSQVAIVLSTLTIAAAFTPLRRRIQQFIDRRFYRRRYNAQQTLARFAQSTRNEVSLESLSGALLHTVDETLQPATVSLWLRPGRGDVRRTAIQRPQIGVEE